MREAHAFYAPAMVGLPGAGKGLGTRLVRFHREQVRLIEAVMAGAVDLETAWLEWQVFRDRLRRSSSQLTVTSGQQRRAD